MFDPNCFSGYIKNNMANKAIDLFNEIKSPDEVILTFFFNACAQIKSNEALDLTKKVYSQMPKSFHSDPRLITSLFDTLIKCGDCPNAEILFSRMKKSVTSYGNLMSGFNKETNPFKTLKLYDQMKLDGIEADLVIYLCLIKAYLNLWLNKFQIVFFLIIEFKQH
jgi:pentatricopeptide repeat protein